MLPLVNMISRALSDILAFEGLTLYLKSGQWITKLMEGGFNGARNTNGEREKEREREREREKVKLKVCV